MAKSKGNPFAAKKGGDKSNPFTEKEAGAKMDKTEKPKGKKPFPFASKRKG
jgi:hypothetical protein